MHYAQFVFIIIFGAALLAPTFRAGFTGGKS
jgi:hypothetical protein